MNTNPDDRVSPHEFAGYAPERGLTKREHFAAMAMQALLQTTWKTAFREKFPNATAEDIETAVAQASTTQADALINALNE